MEKRLEALEKEVRQLKARHLADLVLLDTLVRTLPTDQLQALSSTFAPLAEVINVKFIYGPWSEAEREVASAKLQEWKELLQEQVQARLLSTRQT